MTSIYLGYPGVGLKVWTEQAEDPSKVVWKDTLAAEDLADIPEGVTSICAPLTMVALKAAVDAKLKVFAIYPSTIAMAEYAERQKEEGLSDEQVAKNMTAFNSDLRNVREFESSRVRHLVLGRGEEASSLL